MSDPREGRAIHPQGDTLAAAVGYACGAAVTALRRIPVLGEANVFDAVVGGRRVVVKDQPQPRLVDVEVWGMERFVSFGMRVPALVAVDTSCDVHPRAFFVMEYVEGVPLTALAAGDALYELGRQLRAVHEVPVQGYGLIGGGGTPGVGVSSSWSDATRGYLEWGLQGLERNQWIDEQSADRVRGFFDAYEADLDTCPPRLLHGDLHAEHVLVDPKTGNLAGVIDLYPWSGEPAFDLARLVVSAGDRTRAPLLAGYGATTADLDARWQLHELSFLVAVTFWHHARRGDPTAWTARLQAALDTLRQAD